MGFADNIPMCDVILLQLSPPPPPPAYDGGNMNADN